MNTRRPRQGLTPLGLGFNVPLTHDNIRPIKVEDVLFSVILAPQHVCYFRSPLFCYRVAQPKQPVADLEHRCFAKVSG